MRPGGTVKHRGGGARLRGPAALIYLMRAGGTGILSAILSVSIRDMENMHQ